MPLIGNCVGRGVPALVDKLDTDRQNDVNGLSYEDYLQIFLFDNFKGAKS